MSRVPNTGPAERERQQQIRKLEALLRQLDRLPAHRREDEVADVRAGMCRRRLAELRAPGYALPPKVKATVEIIDIDDWLEEQTRTR